MCVCVCVRWYGIVILWSTIHCYHDFATWIFPPSNCILTILLGMNFLETNPWQLIVRIWTGCDRIYNFDYNHTAQLVFKVSMIIMFHNMSLGWIQNVFIQCRIFCGVQFAKLGQFTISCITSQTIDLRRRDWKHVKFIWVLMSPPRTRARRL